jgi:hypothetical protein
MKRFGGTGFQPVLRNFSWQAIAAGLKCGKEFFRLGGFRMVIGRPCSL